MTVERRKRHYEIWIEGKRHPTDPEKNKPAELFGESDGTNFKHALSEFIAQQPPGQQKKFNLKARTFDGRGLFQSEEMANEVVDPRLQ